MMLTHSLAAQTVQIPAAVTVGVVLPLYAQQLQSAAMVVEAGMLAAQEVENAPGLVLHFYPTDAQAEHAQKTYEEAAQHSDYVISALNRMEAERLIAMDKIATPTISLTTPDADANGTLTKQNVVMMGLSLAEEARQIGQIIAGSAGNGRTVLISTHDIWQQRIVQAFKQQSRYDGLWLSHIQLSGHPLSPAELSKIKQQIKQVNPSSVVLALDRAQTSMISSVLPKHSMIGGTSALNPFITDKKTTVRYPELNGILLLDIPWQVKPEAAYIKRYPKPNGYLEMRATSDQRRLYALGIDAYNVIKELALKQSNVDINGMTGALTVNLGQGGVTYFQRRYERAVYKNGMVVPLNETDNALY